jgi:hypothetical protein
MQIQRLGHFLKRQNKGKGTTPFHLMKINQNGPMFFSAFWPYPILMLKGA